MRNYIGQLQQLGYTLKSIATESCLSSSQLSRLKSGKILLKSSTPEYEKIRNVSRRLAYRTVRSSGLTSERATAIRRNLPSPKIDYSEPEKTYSSQSFRTVKAKEATTRFQLRILGLFYNLKTQ